MQNTKENQATIGNLIDELIDSVIDDNTHDNCVQRQIDKLKQVIFSGGWISVDDELPKSNGDFYLVFTDKGSTKECRYYCDKWVTTYCNNEKVTHWQPLPEFPHYSLATVIPTSNKGVKPMTELLTPQEVLQALIDGQDIEFIEQDSDEWYEFNKYFGIKYLYEESLSFRLMPKKQEMITIGDVSFPKPYQGEMEYNEVYHVPRIDYKSLYNSTRWDGGAEDRMMMSRGLLHLTKENAIAHAKALIRLSGGCVE